MVTRDRPPVGAVAVTGLGLVTALGIGLDAVWPRLLAGDSAIRTLSAEAFAPPIRLPVLLGAPVPREALAEAIRGAVPRSIWNTSEPACHLWLLAALEAMTQAGLPLPNRERARDRARGQDAGRGSRELLARTGIYVGTGAGSLTYTEGAYNGVYAGTTPAQREVERFAVPKYMASSMAGQLSILTGCEGPAMTLNTACSSGATALLTALDALRLGRVECALAGGVDLSLSAAALRGFAHLGALAPDPGDQSPACRPFTTGRAGMVLGEGSACLVLETAEAVRARGVQPLAWLLGGAMNAEAHSLLTPREDGEGMAGCIRAGLADAGLAPDVVGHVFAHGTGTQANDRAEARALAACLPSPLAQGPTVSATKASLGHTLGAAGAIDAVLAVQGLNAGRFPPLRLTGTPDPECLVRPSGDDGLISPEQVVQVNAFAFGGHNAVQFYGRTSNSWQG